MADVVSGLIGGSRQELLGEMRARSDAELARMRAESEAELARMRAESDAGLARWRTERMPSLDVGSAGLAGLIRDIARAIASIEPKDIVGHARQVLADPAHHDLSELLLAAAAILVFEAPTRPATRRPPDETAVGRISSEGTRLNFAGAPFIRWFTSLSPPARAGVLSAAASLSGASVAELEAAGLRGDLVVVVVQLSFVLSVVALLCSVASGSKE